MVMMMSLKQKYTEVEMQDLRDRIAELEGELVIEKSKLLNHIRWLNESRITMQEASKELRSIDKEWLLHSTVRERMLLVADTLDGRKKDDATE